MLDFSFGELLVIVVAALVFIGPKELPVVVRALAKALRVFRSMTHQVREMFDEVLKETGMEDVKDTLNKNITLIRGDDGLMYESYDMSKIAGLPKEEPKPEAPAEPEEKKPA